MGGRGASIGLGFGKYKYGTEYELSLIHISEPTRLGMISYAVFCLKKKKTRDGLLTRMPTSALKKRWHTELNEKAQTG